MEKESVTTIESPWMNVTDLRDYLRLPNKRSVYRWLKSYRVPTSSTGKLLVHRQNVNRVLAGLSPIPMTSFVK